MNLFTKIDILSNLDYLQPIYLKISFNIVAISTQLQFFNFFFPLSAKFSPQIFRCRAQRVVQISWLLKAYTDRIRHVSFHHCTNCLPRLLEA